MVFFGLRFILVFQVYLHKLSLVPAKSGHAKAKDTNFSVNSTSAITWK